VPVQMWRKQVPACPPLTLTNYASKCLRARAKELPSGRSTPMRRSQAAAAASAAGMRVIDEVDGDGGHASLLGRCWEERPPGWRPGKCRVRAPSRLSAVSAGLETVCIPGNPVRKILQRSGLCKDLALAYY
jgi:hypothetical protein